MRYLKLFIIPIAMLTACKQPASNSSTQADTLASPTDTVNKIDVPVAADKLIVPGESIGKTHLNEDLEVVVKRLGKPDAGDAAMGKSLSIWYADHDTTGHQTMIYTTRQMGTSDDVARVKQIRITSPWFVTKEGVHCGSAKTDIDKYYKTADFATVKKSGKAYTVYNTTTGIAFEIDAAGSCKAIIVYSTDSKPGGLYLPFYDNVEMKQ